MKNKKTNDEQKLICKRCNGAVWITLTKEQESNQVCMDCGSVGHWRKDDDDSFK